MPRLSAGRLGSHRSFGRVCADLVHPAIGAESRRASGGRVTANRLPAEVRTSIIVAAELRYGCAKSGSTRLLQAVEDLLGEISVLPFDVPADAEYDGIRSKLEAAGKPIGSNDLLIAAHAYATGATIVTANVNEFKRIRGLNVENWLA